MRKSLWAVAALASTVLAGGVAAAAANAADQPREVGSAAAFVAPTVQQGDALLYDLSTAQAAWKEAAGRFQAPLPEGYRLSGAFELADADATGDVFVETAVIDMLLAEEYRCSWLDAGLQGTAIESEVDRALATYWTLPSVKQFDQTGLTSDAVDGLALKLGYTDSNAALFAIACTGWTER